ncbi:hypothetical protein VUJ46_04005 [Chryseobacterium sp. MYb264]|uniref:hypothetical protein n=1 Tax=Chryseobacterium sp. MYb264 TaxID=2745153 RepID=UPI002E0E2790|nr:hypothetical protein VUJ46_04005 [Chryseobacterium sp. MYb264]
MKTLTQKDGRNSKYLEIQEDGVFVKNNFAKEVNEYKVYFGDINEDETVFRKSKDLVLIAIVLIMVFNSILLTIIINDHYGYTYPSGMIVFGVAMLPSLIVASICNTEFRRENVKNIGATKPLSFLYRKKDIQEVDLFISKIKDAKKQYFLKEYYKVDSILPYQVQMGRIHWLYDNRYINESDAKFIIDELESKRIIEGL